MPSYGMGRWNVKMWAVWNTGITVTTTQSAGTVAVADYGLPSATWSNVATPTTVNATFHAGKSTVTHSACATTTSPFYNTFAAHATEVPETLVSGYLMS